MDSRRSWTRADRAAEDDPAHHADPPARPAGASGTGQGDGAATARAAAKAADRRPRSGDRPSCRPRAAGLRPVRPRTVRTQLGTVTERKFDVPEGTGGRRGSCRPRFRSTSNPLPPARRPGGRSSPGRARRDRRGGPRSADPRPLRGDGWRCATASRRRQLPGSSRTPPDRRRPSTDQPTSALLGRSRRRRIAAQPPSWTRSWPPAGRVDILVNNAVWTLRRPPSWGPRTTRARTG